jgi:hypothetical protein
MQVMGFSYSSRVTWTTLSEFVSGVLYLMEKSTFSPLLHPIAMNSPDGSYRLVKPGEGRREEWTCLQKHSLEVETLGLGNSIYNSI